MPTTPATHQYVAIAIAIAVVVIVCWLAVLFGRNYFISLIPFNLLMMSSYARSAAAIIHIHFSSVHNVCVCVCKCMCLCRQ